MHPAVLDALTKPIPRASRLVPIVTWLIQGRDVTGTVEESSSCKQSTASSHDEIHQGTRTRRFRTRWTPWTARVSARWGAIRIPASLLQPILLVHPYVVNRSYVA